MIKIKLIDEEKILFDNGDTITFDHCSDCCEWNYADFQQIDDIARGWKFDENKMAFEAVDGSGFRFGNLPNKMVFVPCYSDQNGYYSSDVDIYYKGKQVLNLECEMV